MKLKYTLLAIICSIMFLTCYHASKITSSASEYPTDKMMITSNPYGSNRPSLIPVTKHPKATKKPTITPTSKVNSIKGTVSNTASPSGSTTKPSANTSTLKKKTYDGPVRIPTIYSPTLNGTSILKNKENTAFMDVTNKNKGYIGIKYLGDNHKVKVQIKKDSNTYNYDLPSDGQYVIYPLQLGNGTYSVTVLENVSGTQYLPILNESITASIANPNTVFLYPNQYVWFTQNSAVVKKSAQICHGYTKTIDKISAIFEYVTTSIRYDYSKAKTVKSGYLPNVDEILTIRKGICFDYAAVMASMCRAQGIPTKLITGYVSPNGVYHAWNEVYTKEKGWITVSFYLNNIGFNIVDPTFYSNMSDNKEAATYIGNGSNYKNYHIY